MKIALKPHSYIIFLLWLALAAGCAPSVPKASKLAPAEVIVAFGDSLTFVTDILYQRDQKSDAIHPNAKGYRRMAEAIAALLKKAGAL